MRPSFRSRRFRSERYWPGGYFQLSIEGSAPSTPYLNVLTNPLTKATSALNDFVMTSVTVEHIYAEGARVRTLGEFKDLSGLYIDPAAVQFLVQPPGGATVYLLVYGTDAQVLRDSAGHYHCDIYANVTGRWHYRYQEPASETASDKSFLVLDSQLVSA